MRAAVVVAVTGLIAGCMLDEDGEEQCRDAEKSECYCYSGSVCDLSCHGNDACSLDCQDFSNCDMSCEGADLRCDVHCDHGSRCEIDAANELVNVDCHAIASTCVVERCLVDRCTVECNGNLAVRTGDAVECVKAASTGA